MKKLSPPRVGQAPTASPAAPRSRAANTIVARTLRVPVTLSSAQIAALPKMLALREPLPAPWVSPLPSQLALCRDGLALGAPSVDLSPACWIALGERYLFHLGTCRVWDSWAGQWCNSAFRALFNMPRVSVVEFHPVAFSASESGIVEAGLYTAGEPRRLPEKAVRVWHPLSHLLLPHVPLPPDRHEGYTLAFHSSHAQHLVMHERRYGLHSAPVNALSLLWVRRGKPSYGDCSPLIDSWPQVAEEWSRNT